jgi:Gas vesicle protein G
VGLFTGLLTLPLAPVRGVVWIAEQVVDELERELYDEDSIRRELLELELEYEDGMIGEEERLMKEQELMERLSVSRDGVAYPEVNDDG